MKTEIQSYYDLRKKLIPVLRTRIHELKRLGILNVTEQDIWNYLVYAKWKSAEGLTLSEMVNDILSVEIE